MNQVQPWMKHFLPESSYFSDRQEEEKAIVLIRSTPLIFSLVTLVMLQRALSFGVLSEVHLFALTIIASVPFSLKYFKSYKLSASIIPLASLILLPYLAMSEGGYHSQSLIWFGGIPLLSFYFLGPSTGLWISLLSLFELIVLAVLQTYGKLGNDFLNPSSPFATKAAAIITLTIFTTIFARLFENQIRNTQTQLKKANDLVEAAINEKNAFWTNLSHEIKTPLNGILGLSEVVLASSLSQAQREYILHIKDSAEALNLILRDVIDFSQLERAEISLNKSPCELRELLDNLVTMFSFSAKSKGLNISWSADQDIPEMLILDEKRLAQILSNLVSNAIKFTMSGSIKIVVEHDVKNNFYKFSVIDTGVGINKDQIKNLFEPFRTRKSDVVQSESWGTGLGLAISQKLCKLMGSDLLVKTNLGKGSEFSFTIEALSMMLSKKEFAPALKAPLLKRGQNSYILVAEDNLVNQKLLSNYLEKLGYRYKMTSNGKEALEAATEESFDLILMDIQMPLMNGIEATKLISAKLRDKMPKVIAVSANIIDFELAELKSVGVQDFLPKPISLNSLRNCLRQHCEFYEDPHVLYSKLDHREKEKILHLSNDSSELIERDMLLEHFEYDLGLIEDLVKQFHSRSSTSLKELSEAIQKKDYNSIKFLSHSLKGAISNFFCESLRNCALAIEQKALLQDYQNMDELFKTLESGIPKMVDEIKNIIEQEKSLSEAA